MSISPSDSSTPKRDTIAADLYRGRLGLVEHQQSTPQQNEVNETQAGSPSVDLLLERIGAHLDTSELASSDEDRAALLNEIALETNQLFQGSGTAIAMEQGDGVQCVASAGENAPDVGTPLNVSSGISGICFRTGEPQKCLSTSTDGRVDAASCKALGIASILIAPVKHDQQTIGLIEVFSGEEFFFNNNDSSDLQRIAALIHKVWANAKSMERASEVIAATPGETYPPASVTVLASNTAAAVQTAPEPARPIVAETEIVVKTKKTESDIESSPAGIDPILAAPAERLGSPTLVEQVRFSSPASSGSSLSGASPAVAVTADPASSRSSEKPSHETSPHPYARRIIAGVVVVLLGAGGWTMVRALRSVPSVVASQPATANGSSENTSTAASSPSATQEQTSQTEAEASQPVASKTKTVAKPVASTPSIRSGNAAVQDSPLKREGQSSESNGRVADAGKDKSEFASTPVSEAPPTSGVSFPVQRFPVNILAANTAAPIPAGTAAFTATEPAPKAAPVEIEPEQLINRVAPIYPAIARSSRITGDVTVNFTITIDGRVANPVITSGHPLLTGAVLDAVRKWRYKPYLRNGIPQEVQTKAVVRFKE